MTGVMRSMAGGAHPATRRYVADPALLCVLERI